MSVANNKTTRTSLILMLIAAAAMLVAGCKGQVEAPYGSTIAIEAFGGVTYAGSVACQNQTPPNGAKTQQYKVTVLDASGIPMNGAAVNLWGNLTNGQNVNFGGKVDSAGGSPFVIKSTDDFGFFLLDVTVPCFAFGQSLQMPFSPTGTPSSTGGGLADGTYYYTITAKDLIGETNAFGPISVTVSGATSTVTGSSTGMVTLSWPSVPGASSYNVYGYSTLSPGLGLLGNVIPQSPSIDPVTWTDNGNWWPQSAVAPPVGNTTGLSYNNVRGTIQATTGAASESLNMNF